MIKERSFLSFFIFLSVVFDHSKSDKIIRRYVYEYEVNG